MNHTLTENHKVLIKDARKKHGKIYPCGSKKSFGDCFTVQDNKLYFWFDTPDRSTHVLEKEVAR